LNSRANRLRRPITHLQFHHDWTAAEAGLPEGFGEVFNILALELSSSYTYTNKSYVAELLSLPGDTNARMDDQRLF
jgi:hypothetical protein